tara:strand:- start:931 stop:1317 length:387 start_codon:yes stop_codon:yes gene_type:complete
MTSVLNIEPNHLIIRYVKDNQIYDFLNFIRVSNINIDIKKYYDLLNSIDSFKLKNIYDFIYLRVYKIREKTDNRLDPFPRRDGKVSSDEINKSFNEYINPSGCNPILLNSIVLMNGIQIYFNPHINLS